MPLQQYHIPGSVNVNPHECFNDPKTYPNFQRELEKFKELLVDLVDRRANKTFYKFGDGDYYFLTKNPVGSATPGSGALFKKGYDDIDHEEFVKNTIKNDFVLCEIYPENRRMWAELYPKRKIDFPAEFAYGLFYNRWLFKTFKGRIGLIVAKEKLELIQELFKFKQYRDYIQMDGFVDYIYFPQKGSADDYNATLKYVAKQLKTAKADIYLMGLGHAKSAILHRFKDYKKAVYLDVGSGIDGLAGMIRQVKPYAGDWINFRIEGYDYSQTHQDYVYYTGSGQHVFLRRGKKDDLLDAALNKARGGMLKHPQYFDVYHHHFQSLRDKKIKLLEIGVRKGGSLWMWKKYFPLGKITGIDNQPQAKQWEGPNIEIFIGDQADAAFLRRVSQEAGPFDIVIDDGGHMMHQVRISFLTLFPLLKETGIYVIEDTHTSYWPNWGGKLYGAETTVEMLKSLVDRLQWWAYRWPHAGEFKINKPLDYLEANPKSLHFYDGMCLIYKGRGSDPKVWEDGVVRDYDI